MIVTIGGAYGCGSEEAAKIVGEKLGYKVYDDEIVKEAYKAGSTYLDESTLRYYDESESSAALEDIAELSRVQKGITKAMQSLSLDVLPLDLRLDAAIHGALSRLADGDNCILLGRCANYYLRGRENVITLFFADSDEHKVERIMKHLECDAATAQKFIKRTDKRRADFYSYFTGEKWDDAGNYDVRINCELLGVEGSAELILDLVRIKEKQLQ